MSITYTKLKSGEYGLRSTTPISGVVIVRKKSGEMKTERVGNKIWSGNDVYLYAIGGRANRERMGSGHGSAASVPGYSSYCTDNASCRCYDCAS